MQTRPELILLQKTMVVVEGVARGFDPKLDIWKVADPVVREWIERNLGPIGRIQGAMSGAGELGRVMASLPAIASRAVAVLENLERMTREGLTLSPETIAAMGRTEGRKSRWRTLALWIIAGDLHRNPVRGPAIVIAMHVIDVIALTAYLPGRPPMASLTIRKLDEAVKAYLRLRSAGNGRSVEEEVRVILGELIQGRPEFAEAATASPASPESSAGPAARQRHRRAATSP